VTGEKVSRIIGLGRTLVSKCFEKMSFSHLLHHNNNKYYEEYE
jgi:hypothetical protein